VARLLTSQRDGYREAAHHLCFPRLGWRYETHSAVLFQRGVVLDALLDAAAAGLAVPGQVLDAEVMAILRMKHRDVRGGWNYIPAVAELPPDADDLGQVLQILYRHGGADLAATCDEGIRLVLDGAGPDGSFNTWILDPRGRSPADQAIRAYVGVVDRIVTGGWGVHPEVVANLLYGLLLYDPVRYRDPLRRASAYLLAMQQESGAWPSKWYAGPYYGTFCAVAVLGVLTPNSPALSRARAFLLSKQHADGSWGEEGGDPLSTGLALLALCRGCFSRVPGTDTAVERGADYLARTQEADGGWPAVTWLSFLSLDGPIASGSRTITTAFCLKALLAVWSTR
jgi:squalene-hopene/tetraprenyl-beta-curcumene cyclase